LPEIGAGENVNVSEALRGIMDGFDPFYGPTAGEETDEARRRALAVVARSKEYMDPARGRDVMTGKLIDLIFPKASEEKPPSWPEMRDLLLGVLETNGAEVDVAMRRMILLARLERLVGGAADNARLRPAASTEEWTSRDQVYRRDYDGWEVTLGYFPEHVRHHAMYGGTLAPPLINKKLAVSARYHRTEHYMVPELRAAELPDLLAFLKSPELDLLAKSYGISYDLPPLGMTGRATTHTAKGGYKVMVETLEEELKKSPYSAEKLIGELSTVTIFHEDPGLSLHVVVEFPKGRPDVGQNLALVFGADLFSLAKERWDEFKKMPPVAMAALETLKG
jgi:hypothetical protein